MDIDVKWFDALQLRVSLYSRHRSVLLGCVLHLSAFARLLAISRS